MRFPSKRKLRNARRSQMSMMRRWSAKSSTGVCRGIALKRYGRRILDNKNPQKANEPKASAHDQAKPPETTKSQNSKTKKNTSQAKPPETTKKPKSQKTKKPKRQRPAHTTKQTHQEQQKTKKPKSQKAKKKRVMDGPTDPQIEMHGST